MFTNESLLQTNKTATCAPNSCSYADITEASLDQAIMEQKETAFKELFYFNCCRNDCLALWNGKDVKLPELYSYIRSNILNRDLNFAMEICN